MATTESANKCIHAATATTVAETWALLQPVKQVRVTNRDTDSTLFVTINTGATAVKAEAGIVTAVASADETFVVPAGQSKIIMKSPRATFVAGSVVGSATDYDVEGTEWFD